MARYRGFLQGGRRGVTRLGHRGLETHAYGWSSGIRVVGQPGGRRSGKDIFRIYATSGSDPAGGASQYIATVMRSRRSGQFFVHPKVAVSGGSVSVRPHVRRGRGVRGYMRKR